MRRRKVTILILGAISLIAVSWLLIRPTIARSLPGATAYLSCSDGLFTYSKKFDSGSVGPFSVGQTKDAALSGLNSYGRSFIIPMELSKAEADKMYFRRQIHVTPQIRSFLKRSDHWRVSFHEQGATTVYDVDFKGGRSARIALLATLTA